MSNLSVQSASDFASMDPELKAVVGKPFILSEGLLHKLAVWLLHREMVELLSDSPAKAVDLPATTRNQ